MGIPKPVQLLNETARPVDKVVEVENIVRWRGAGRAVSDSDEDIREGSDSPCDCPE